MIFTNKNWENRVLNSSCAFSTFNDNCVEKIGAHYYLSPIEDQVASVNKLIFDPKKAAAMYFWYKSADPKDSSIIEYFEEYKSCIDKTHPRFNSNYGVYAYKQEGLKRCIDTLIENKNSRQACFCINDNYAMSPYSIDKLCTNAIHFLIRDHKLIMIVQMRSSNILTLLPYDFFIFSVWYAFVFNKLITKYSYLLVDNIYVSVASLHYYEDDYQKKHINLWATSDDKNVTNIPQIFSLVDMYDKDFEKILETRLTKFLNN